MIHVKKFVFSPFQENTYVLYSDEGSAWIIDPGCYDSEEEKELADFIEQKELKAVQLINTHCHLDHVFGNHFVHEKFGLKPIYHSKDQPTMDLAPISANIYGVPGFKESPEAHRYLDDDTQMTLDGQDFEIVFVPGHAPGHIALINHDEKYVIGGDVLFQGSIGRTDLPGDDFKTLAHSIKSHFYILADDYVVYSGHGPETTIGHEKKNNPFVKL